MYYTDWCTVCEFIERRKKDDEKERPRENTRTHTNKLQKIGPWPHRSSEQQF